MRDAPRVLCTAPKVMRPPTSTPLPFATDTRSQLFDFVVAIWVALEARGAVGWKRRHFMRDAWPAPVAGRVTPHTMANEPAMVVSRTVALAMPRHVLYHDLMIRGTLAEVALVCRSLVNAFFRY